MYLCSMKIKPKKIIKIGWNETERFVSVGKLIQQNKAKKLYYSCDKFYYEVEKGNKV